MGGFSDMLLDKMAGEVISGLGEMGHLVLQPKSVVRRI